MSERMVELQRARLGLPPMGTTAAPPAAVAASASRPPMQRQTSQQLAAAAVYQEEEQLKIFLQRLSKQRDDSHPMASSGPTVPTALTRRMLQQQGVGYLDDTVAALTSAAADRFLATVLQQAVACRDRRCKGMALAKEEASRRRKHISLYNQDDRKRRKGMREEQKLKANLAAVAAAKELTDRKADGKPPPKKKSKKAVTPTPDNDENGNKPKPENVIGDHEPLDDDSMDEEERYYQECYEGYDLDSDDEEEDDTKFMLLLRDLERPLEAWQFKLTGKVGLGAIPMETVEPTVANNATTAEEYNNNAEEADDNVEGGDDEVKENGEANGDASGSKRMKSPKPSPTKAESKSGDSSAPESAATSRAATPMVSSTNAGS